MAARDDTPGERRGLWPGRHRRGTDHADETADAPGGAVVPIQPPPVVPARIPHMADVADYLRARDLPPLPINYNAAWVALGGPEGVADAGGGALPPDERGAAALDRLIADAQRTLDGMSTLIDETRAQASAYGDALFTETDAPTADMLAKLVTLTRTMIACTRDADRRMRAMGDEMSVLQGHLDEARTVATCDPLTGLDNRRAIEARLDAAVTRIAEDGHGTLLLAYCDIDHFKAINDRMGHAVGDRVLKLVSRLFADGVGEGGRAGRYGGEEFLLVFDGVAADAVAERVDAVRRDLAARTLRVRDTNEPIGTVTFSAGIARYGDHDTREALVRRADAALYRAKAGGRNRIEQG